MANGPWRRVRQRRNQHVEIPHIHSDRALPVHALAIGTHSPEQRHNSGGPERRRYDRGSQGGGAAILHVISAIVGTANPTSLAVAWTGEFTAQTGSRARVLPAPNGFSRAAWLNQDEGRIVARPGRRLFRQMDAADGYATPRCRPDRHPL